MNNSRFTELGSQILHILGQGNLEDLLALWNDPHTRDDVENFRIRSRGKDAHPIRYVIDLPEASDDFLNTVLDIWGRHNIEVQTISIAIECGDWRVTKLLLPLVNIQGHEDALFRHSVVFGCGHAISVLAPTQTREQLYDGFKILMERYNERLPYCIESPAKEEQLNTTLFKNVAFLVEHSGQPDEFFTYLVNRWTDKDPIRSKFVTFYTAQRQSQELTKAVGDLEPSISPMRKM